MKIRRINETFTNGVVVMTRSKLQVTVYKEQRCQMLSNSKVKNSPAGGPRLF